MFSPTSVSSARSFYFLLPYAWELQSEFFTSFLASVPLRTSFSSMAFKCATLVDAQVLALGLMVWSVYTEILNNSIFEFVLYKWWLMKTMEYEPRTWSHRSCAFHPPTIPATTQEWVLCPLLYSTHPETTATFCTLRGTWVQGWGALRLSLCPVCQVVR